MDPAARPVTVRAPGRVNLMGDHTDYNRGLVLPMTLDRWCEITITPSSEPVVRARSGQFGGDVVVSLEEWPDPRTVEPRWGRFVAGAIAALREREDLAAGGADLAVSSTVPPGSGLSSSSAFAVALTLALTRADALPRDPWELARVALDAEVRATGVPGGLMDQLASLDGRRDHALLIDFDELTVEPVPLPPTRAVLVVHCGTERTLAGTEYAARRAECEAVAARLCIDSLRRARAQQVADEPRARHVVSENARVLAMVEAMRDDDLDAMGRLMLESHASLRDDYAVSTPELDALVGALVSAGAAGARLTGAGFGGCVVAVAERDDAERVLADATSYYRAATALEPMGFVARAVDGARR